MQLSKLKELCTQYSISPSVDFRKKSEALFEVIKKYNSKYKNEFSEDVGISLAAEEVYDFIEAIFKNDKFYEKKLEAAEMCKIKYATQDEIAKEFSRVYFEKDDTLSSYYNKIKRSDIIKRAKKEDILKAFELLEVANDSANSNNS